LPQAKLIALLRNPVERALSHHQHEFLGKRESLSFAEAIDKEAERLAGEEERLQSDPHYYSFNHHRYSYTRRGLYLEQLRRWVRHFPRSQLLVLQSEWLFRDPAAATVAVHRFLGLRPHRLERYKSFAFYEYERNAGGAEGKACCLLRPTTRTSSAGWVRSSTGHERSELRWQTGPANQPADSRSSWTWVNVNREGRLPHFSWRPHRPRCGAPLLAARGLGVRR